MFALQNLQKSCQDIAMWFQGCSDWLCCCFEVANVLLDGLYGVLFGCGVVIRLL